MHNGYTYIFSGIIKNFRVEEKLKKNFNIKIVFSKPTMYLWQ